MKDTYIKLYQLQKLKEKLNLKYNLLDLYNLKKLYLNDNKIKEILKEIGQLQKLQALKFRL